MSTATLTRSATPTGRQARPTRARRRLSAPGRLRAWTAVLVLGAGALAAVVSGGLLRLDGEVRTIGDQTAPQAATASDLYFALSDLDAQVATLIMLGRDDALSTDRLDALRTYRLRDAEVDADLALAQRRATSADDRDAVGRIGAGLTLYRQWVTQALALQEQRPATIAGRTAPAALGYYAEATTVLRGELLPSVAALRRSNGAGLSRSYARERITTWVAVALIGLVGGALIVALVAFQRRMSRQFRRTFNPSLLLATGCAIAVVVGGVFVFLDETTRLDRAQHDDFAPYLALTHAQAVSYDAAGDTSRYLIVADPGAIRADVEAKARCLREGGSCGGGDVLPAGGLGTLAGGSEPVLARWAAYADDQAKILSLADAGDPDTALARATGINRGDATFDLFFYNQAVSRLTTEHRAAFDAELATARSRLAYLPVAPAVLMGFAALLTMMGVRPRLAEYR